LAIKEMSIAVIIAAVAEEEEEDRTAICIDW